MFKKVMFKKVNEGSFIIQNDIYTHTVYLLREGYKYLISDSGEEITITRDNLPIGTYNVDEFKKIASYCDFIAMHYNSE